MYIEQLYTNCLAEAAYYIESEGPNGREAAIIDPIRETRPYLEKAASRGARVRYILETHFHADFVSGHLDLARLTGAEIVFGPNAGPSYPVHEAKDGEVLPLGTVSIEVLHTPGHTPESTTYLLRDEQGAPYAIFSGDTLFVGDVGRPDLLGGTLSKEALAGMLYDSLQSKIKPLPDDLLVYPAHGPGSSCGKNIGPDRWTTLGREKQTNYALQNMSREEFIDRVTTGLAAPPQYYFEDAAINKRGYTPIEEVMARNDRPVSLAELDKAIAHGALVLDARKPAEYAAGHIPGSVNIGLDGTYAWWAGTLLSIDTPLVIVANAGEATEAIGRLARIGYENALGYLPDGIAQWSAAGRPLATVDCISPENFDAASDRAVVLDVRNTGEFAAGHVDGAINIPLGQLPRLLSGETESGAGLPDRVTFEHQLDPDAEYLVHCAGGYRSMIAISLMQRAGFRHLHNVDGGFGKMQLFSNRITAPVASHA